MSAVYITGHRNPDLDSLCSVLAYAEFKGHVDPDTRYIPIRCGAMGKAAKELFQREGITPPQFIGDLFPRILDIVKSGLEHCRADDPLYDVMSMLSSRTLSVVPVFLEEGQYAGLISVDDVSEFFLKEHTRQRPVYEFYTENFSRVLPGCWVKTGDQTRFAAPLMTGAMPADVSRKRIRRLAPQKPLMVVGMREEIVDIAVEGQFPALVLTGYEEGETPSYDFSGYRGSVFVSYLDTAETIRRLRLSLPIRNLLKTDVPRVQSGELFDEGKSLLVSSEHRGLPVFEGKQFIGVVTRRCFIDRPKKRVIMADHNEPMQSIRGIEDAEVTEIIDHHRFAAEKTRYPIYISAAPVGSTCTLVWDHFRRSGIAPSRQTARLLLAGILSDTVLLKSPTACSMDRDAVFSLAEPAQLSDPIVYGEQIFSAGMMITEAHPRDVVQADFKVYDEFGCRFGIGQAEVISLEPVREVQDRLLEALDQTGTERRLDWVMLLVTDVIREHSILLTTDHCAGRLLAYEKIQEGVHDLPGILSRKKQLLPEVLRVLEECSVSCR